MELLTNANEKWIYTYDYAPDSVWEPWRESEAVPDWIEAEADSVAMRVKKITDQTNAELSTFVLLADSHYTINGTWDDTVSAMRAVSQRIRIDGIVHLGDLTDGLLPLEKTKEFEKICISDMDELGVPVYITPGNHDYNYFRGNPEIRYPETPQYYVDIPGQKLRFFFIDSFDPKEELRYGFTDYCIHWLEAEFTRMPEDYSAVIFSHLTPLVRLQAWAKDIRNRNKLIEVLNANADRIIAFLNGHNHCDQLFNDLKNGQFPLISINCAKCEYFTDHKPEGATVPERRLGDCSQESFDIMQIDAARKEMFFTRFGAGSDRYVRNHKAYWAF